MSCCRDESNCCQGETECCGDDKYNQDVVEFISIASHLGWTEEHSLGLIQLEEKNDAWDDGHHFAKEKHCAHLKGYLHACEQTEKQITEWMEKLGR